MIKSIFFDIDDTLYSSSNLASMARLNSVRAMIDAGLPEKNEDRVYEDLKIVIGKYGPNYPRHYDKLLSHMGLTPSPKIVAAGVVAYEQTKIAYLVPFPEVVPTLIKLKSNLKLGIISNGIALKQWEKLIGLGIHHFFDLVTTSEGCGVEKPEKDIFLEAIGGLDLKPEECLMVGDRLDTDIEGGNLVGMVTVFVKKGARNTKPERDSQKPDYTIDSIVDLLGQVKKIP